MTQLGGRVVGAISAFALVGCGGPDLFSDANDQRFRAAAENVIEVDLAPGIGLGTLNATCEGSDLGPTVSFTCAAVVADADSPIEQPIRFTALVSDDGTAVDVASTNLLLAQQVDAIEATAASVLASRVDWTTIADHVDCADRSVIVADDNTLRCVVVNPGPTEDSDDDIRYPATIVIEDFTTLTITVTLER